MFGQQTPVNHLYLVVVKIGRGSNTEMPSSLSGAIVPVFAQAPDHEAAARSAVSALVAQGFQFIDLQGSITQLDPSSWSNYVASVWPEFQENLPNQADLTSYMQSARVFFGPFAGYGGA